MAASWAATDASHDPASVTEAPHRRSPGAAAGAGAGARGAGAGAGAGARAGAGDEPPGPPDHRTPKRGMPVRASRESKRVSPAEGAVSTKVTGPLPRTAALTSKVAHRPAVVPGTESRTAARYPGRRAWTRRPSVQPTLREAWTCTGRAAVVRARSLRVAVRPVAPAGMPRTRNVR